MKKLFISMLAVAALASCTNDETLSLNPGEAISFGGPFIENATRADVAVDPSYTNSTLKAFKVWGTIAASDGQSVVPIYANNKVEGNVGAGNVWKVTDENAPKQYWVNGASYKFAALVNAGGVTLGDDKLPAKAAFDATLAATDFLYAEPVSRTGEATGNVPVAFTFEHLLSKVKFTVNNGSTTATGYSFVVKDIKVKGYKAGEVTLAGRRTWDFTDKTKADYTVADIEVASGDAKEENAQELLLIPGNFDITFKVDILSQGSVIATHSYPATAGTAYNATLEGGKAYNFQINVAVGEEITFSVLNAPTWGNYITLP